MSRIRSVHPGLFTDEGFVSLSADAQILLIGIWTEADDQGIFEWKPVTLRMRLRPTKDGPIEPFLAELAAANCIARYEIDGRQYGAIRNFRKYQRPKSPNSVHPMPRDIRKYVGLSPPISEINGVDAPPLPPNGEIAPQMEDVGEGGRREDGEDSEPRGSDGGKAALAFAGRIIRLNPRDLSAWRTTYHAIPDLMAELATLDGYYDQELRGKDRKNWFVRCSSALDKKHQERVADSRKPGAPALAGRAVI